MRWTWLGGRGLPYFKRGGACVETYTWLEEWHAHCFEPETVARLRRAGFNLVTIPYFAGFGLRTEAPWLEAAPKLVESCHDQGMRALATIDLGGVCLETMADEVPQLDEWLHHDPDGRVVWASPEQYWRGRPDLTHAGYRQYIGQVIERALRAGFDGIWFDDVEPRLGYQPAAVAEWREFISRYTDFYSRKCGYLTHEYLAPPPHEVPGDPLWLDWEDFWQQRFVGALADYNDRVKRIDPERLTVHSGPFQEQHPWEKYRLHLDAVHLCNPWMPGVEHGEVVSHASLFLISDAAEVLAFGDGVHRPRTRFADPPVAEQVELSLAEGMFFGGQSASASWASLPEGNAAAAPLEAAFGRVEPWHCAFERGDRFDRIERFLRFCERTAELHRSDDSAATIAVLHSRDSLRFEREGTILNLRAAQMACLRRHLPSDVLVSDDLARLDRYDVLIVPEQACLSQAALERIASWVRGGGGLILVGEAAVRARRGRLRPPDWLATALGITSSRWSLPNAEVVPAGNGRVLALPALGVEPFTYPLDAPDPSAGWDWLPDAVHDVSAWPVPVTLDGPETLFCRGYWLPNGNLAVMLINYDTDFPGEADLLLNLDWPTQVPTALLHTPGEPEALSLGLQRSAAMVTIRLPAIQVYAVVEVRAQPLGGRRAAAEEELSSYLMELES